jgi:hypothetical protein
MDNSKLVRRFRKVAWGRLYWNKGRNSLMQHMDSDDMCIVKSGTITNHYKTMAAFIHDLEGIEEYEKLKADMEYDLADYENGDGQANRSFINVR